MLNSTWCLYKVDIPKTLLVNAKINGEQHLCMQSMNNLIRKTNVCKRKKSDNIKKFDREKAKFAPPNCTLL